MPCCEQCYAAASQRVAALLCISHTTVRLPGQPSVKVKLLLLFPPGNVFLRQA